MAMAHVLIPIPSLDFDPSEIAVSWAVLTARGHRVTFATPDGRPGQADAIMLTGRGLDPWSPVPVIGHLRLVGLMLRANGDARRAHAAMVGSAAFRAPLRWDALDGAAFDALLLGGGHRARGMRPFLESAVLQDLVAGMFAADKPVAAICHGVLLAARSRRADGASVLHGRRTTALTWQLERIASAIARVTRFWDPYYYRTYRDAPGQPAGHMAVEHEVRRALASPDHFVDVPPDHPQARRKTAGTARDTLTDASPAWVVRDGRYVSARWPGDVHTFAATFAEVLDGR
jgi:putative intracellular protease/amidase